MDCFSQSNLAFVKSGFKSVHVYDSSLKEIIYQVKPETYFWCDNPKGDWYSFNMAYLFDGKIHKDSIQFFHTLPLLRQKALFSNTFASFSNICLLDKDQTLDTLIQHVYNDSIIRDKSELYYDHTYEPLLGEYFLFYSRTKDQKSLLNLLYSVKCRPDGDYAESFYPLLARCYDLDKIKFINTLKSIKNANTKKRYLNALFEGIWEHYTVKYDKTNYSSDKISKLISLEKEKILKLTAASH